MRILILADVVGGVRSFVLELARELAAGGDEVHLALIGPAEGAGELSGLPVASCSRRDLRLEWMDDPGKDVEAAAQWLSGLCREIAPDVLHINTFTPVRDPSVAVVLSVHSCVLTWWRAVHGEDAPASWDGYRQLARRALTRAQVITAPTRALLGALEAVHGPLAAARAIPNGRRVRGGDAASERQPVVLTAGRLWDAAKNIACVVAAAPLIDGEVVAAGPGAPAAAGAEAAMRALGPVSATELLAWMRRAAVFAEPARYEPFGLAALEAAQCGCALVLGDIPSLREVWGEAATFVPPDDPGALAEGVNALLRDPRLRSEVARAGAERAARFTPAAMAAGYRDAYACAQEAVA